MIQIIKNFSILIGDSIKGIAKALFSSFGILFLIAFLVIYISFRDSVKDYIEKNLFGKLAINEIIIYPRAPKENRLFSISLDLGKSIPAAKVKRIIAIKELKNVYPIIKLDYEVKVRGEMMGQARRIHMPVCGIDARFFAGKDPRWRQFRNGKPVPVVAPKAFLDLLNNYFTIIGIPPMDENTLGGFPLQFIITTTPGGKPAENTIEAQIHSITDIFAFMGAIVPKEFITKFAREHRSDTAGGKTGYTHVMVYATVTDVKKLPAVADQIRKLGLSVESQNDIAQKTNNALEIFDQFSIAIIVMFLILTVISIFNSYLTIVYNRSHKFSLQRVLGVSKLQILISFIAESAVVGALYGLIGYFAGKYALNYLSLKVSAWIPSFRGIVIQHARGDLLLMALAFSISISVISAFIPALFAANINLFKAVRK